MMKIGIAKTKLTDEKGESFDAEVLEANSLICGIGTRTTENPGYVAVVIPDEWAAELVTFINDKSDAEHNYFLMRVPCG